MTKLRTFGSRFESKTEDITRCIESVYGDIWSGSHQCSRKRGHGKDGLYCKQHDPEKVEKRREAQQQKWDAEWASRKIELRGPKFLAALKKIAQGELNDPVGYAQMIIDEFEDKS